MLIKLMAYVCMCIYMYVCMEGWLSGFPSRSGDMQARMASGDGWTLRGRKRTIRKLQSKPTHDDDDDDDGSIDHVSPPAILTIPHPMFATSMIWEW